MTEFMSCPPLDPIDLQGVLESMNAHIKDARYVAAKHEYETLAVVMSQCPPSDDGNDPLGDIRAVMTSAVVNQMLERSDKCETALKEYNMETNDDERWVLGLEMFGYRTHYILEEDGNVLVRIEGSQENLPLFEQLSVIRELQLYKEWVPFCSKSEMLHEISHTDMIAFLHIWSPLGKFDCIFPLNRLA